MSSNSIGRASRRVEGEVGVVEVERNARDAQRQCGIPPVVDPDSQDPVPKRPCRREQEWMEDRSGNS